MSTTSITSWFTSFSLSEAVPFGALAPPRQRTVVREGAIDENQPLLPAPDAIELQRKAALPSKVLELLFEKYVNPEEFAVLPLVSWGFSQHPLLRFTAIIPKGRFHEFQLRAVHDAARHGYQNLMLFYLKGLGYKLDKLIDANDCYFHKPTDGYQKSIDVTMAEAGQLDMLRWAITAANVPGRRSHFLAAAGGGQNHVLDWLSSLGCRYVTDRDSYESYLNAAASGHLHTIQWLQERRFPYKPGGKDWFQNTWMQDRRTCDVAEKGRLDILEWLYNRRTPICRDILHSAARGGNVVLFQWLWKKRDELHLNPLPDHKTLEETAAAGHLAMVQYLRNLKPEPCPWTWFATARAAANGHLEVLQWLITNGCPWSASLYNVYRRPDEKLNERIIAYLRQKSLPTEPPPRESEGCSLL